MPEIVLWQAVLFHKHITNNLFLAHYISASYFNSDTQVLNLSGLDPGTVDLTQTYCPALNVSQCLVRFSSQFLLMSISPLLSLNMKFITKQDHLLAGERGGGILHCLCVQPTLMECQPLYTVISVFTSIFYLKVYIYIYSYILSGSQSRSINGPVWLTHSLPPTQFMTNLANCKRRW